MHKRRGQKRKERTFGNDKESEHILDEYDAPAGTQQLDELQDNDGPVLAAFNMDEAEQEEAGLGGEKKKGEEEEDAWLQSLMEQVNAPLHVRFECWKFCERRAACSQLSTSGLLLFFCYEG